MKSKLLTDLPIPECKEDLIGRVFPCPYSDCGIELDIGSSGVVHYGYHHTVIVTLEELFNMARKGKGKGKGKGC